MFRRSLAGLAAGALLVPAALIVAPSIASAPSDVSTLAVPAAIGRTATVSYKGTMPAGANPSVCATPGTADRQIVDITLPAGAYQRIDAHVTFRTTWSDPSVDGVLSVLGPDGVEVDSSDMHGRAEHVTINNPAPGAYTVLACGYSLRGKASYVGSATVETKNSAAAAASKFPAVPSQGLSFTAGVASDPQRDEGEPEIMIDRGGAIYTCGPSGFSNIADYAQVSTDGGDQFHLMGTPPRGQLSTGEGGGDCGLASSEYPNAQGKYNFAYSGLGPLTNFSTATSADTGRSLAGSPISESPPGVDRQWHTFTDAKTVFLNYNQLALGQTVQKSTDGGLTYGPAVTVATDGDRIGPMRTILPKNAADAATKSVVYFPYTSGQKVKLALSRDGGTTWSTCVAVNAEANPNGGFALADHDKAGNVYVVYAETGVEADSYMAALPAAGVSGCKDGKDWPGARPKTRLNRAKVESTVMPWVVASGAPGRVSVAFYGSESIGNANQGSFKGTWDVYVSQTLNGMAKNPAWAQVKATTHPFHYNSICLNGLGCNLSVPEGDRSLADYFAIDLNPKDGRLSTVYNASSKIPTEALGHIATPTVATQNDGPSNLGGKLKKKRNVLRSTAVDPTGDAIAPYSNLTPAVAVPLPSENHPALDFEKASVGPEADPNTGAKVDEGGFNVTMKLKGLSNADLEAALSGTKSQSLVWLWRFYNGYQPAGVTAAYNSAAGFTFGFDSYETRSTESGQADPTAEKIIVWPQRIPIPGKVNQDKGTITLSVPRALLKELAGPTGDKQVPREQKAKPGSRFYEGTAYSLGNSFTPVQAVQSYLYPVDNTPSMDFALPGKKTKASSSAAAPPPSTRHWPALPAAQVGQLALLAALAAAAAHGLLRNALSTRIATA